MDQMAQSASEAAIQFLNGPLAEQILSIQKAEYFIGRHEQNDVVVFDPKVSRQHARIFYQDGSWIIENLSQNGSIFIDQERVQKQALQHNVVVHLSENTSFIFLFTQQPTAQTVVRSHRPSATSFTTPLRTQVIPANNVEPETVAVNDAFHSFLASKSPMDMPSLLISSNIHSNLQTHLLTKPVTNIGRAPENDLVIADPIISAHHAQIIREEDALFFIHPHPSRNHTLNGLWYQGQRIPGDQPFRKQLKNGDIFRVGDEHGTLITLTYDDGTGTFHETLPELAPVPLSSDRLTIGRVPDNTVILNHPQISAHHALLEKVEGGYRILDTNSTNHVYVNGQAITNHLLRTGDEIRIGPYHFTYTGAELKQYDESNHIRIDALQLKKTGSNATVLLNDISLVIPPRKFVALVGGSGAGKSTLMDALNGLRPAQEGTVFYNGVDYYHNLAAFNTQLGYVPQDDIVHRELTVERALYYAARLRLPEDFTRKQIQWRINEVLEDVEMTDRRSLLVSKLSGGQRKRVSIALELLANPSVFFLDEPTSGLDPGLDRKMMSLLRRLADRGRTIVLVTHATNNINACDYVCFLAQGGRLAYFGPPNVAKEFFEKTDFAEIYSTLEPTKEQPDIPQQAEARFRASTDYQRYVAQPLSEKRPPSGDQGLKTIATLDTGKRRRVMYDKGWSQFLLLSMRYLELLKNDRGNLLILLLQAPVIALMLVLMVRFEIGTGVFDANKLVQCHTSILTATGPLALPQSSQTELIDCSQVLTFLKSDPRGQAFATSTGGIQQALQSFLVNGPGADAQKVLFIMAFATVLFGCINGTREFVKEAPIYRRERAVNLGIMPYMFSKIAVLGILCLFQSAVLTFFVEVGEPLHQGIALPPVLETYITLTLTSLAGLMIGLAISAVAPNNDRAVSFVPIILIPQVIFSGAIIPLKDWLTQILAVIFPTRWAMAALGSSIGLHAETIGGDHLFGNDYTYHSTLYSIYSQSDALNRLLLSWIALGVIVVALTIAIGVFLKRKDTRG
jgi:ABC-type multidrug transport system ATPase subunit/pSer/pThr/pTyr-binding forkhead associated (FHA) protein